MREYVDKNGKVISAGDVIALDGEEYHIKRGEIEQERVLVSGSEPIIKTTYFLYASGVNGDIELFLESGAVIIG